MNRTEIGRKYHDSRMRTNSVPEPYHIQKTIGNKSLDMKSHKRCISINTKSMLIRSHSGMVQEDFIKSQKEGKFSSVNKRAYIKLHAKNGDVKSKKDSSPQSRR